VVSTSMTCNDRLTLQNRGFSVFLQSSAVTHISRLKFAEITGNKFKQPAYEFFLAQNVGQSFFLHFHHLSFDLRLRSSVRVGLNYNLNTIQYSTMENLHSKTDKHTVSLI